MAKGMLVSLSALYGDIDAMARGYRSAVLRNTTCNWWNVNPDNAAGTAYVFGVVQGQIVSAYGVATGVAEWPILPPNSIGAGRRSIPVSELSESDWNVALSWSSIAMYGPIRYCEVQLDSSGSLVGIQLTERKPLDDEMAEPIDS